jgi:hypothetical protein
VGLDLATRLPVDILLLLTLERSPTVLILSLRAMEQGIIMPVVTGHMLQVRKVPRNAVLLKSFHRDFSVITAAGDVQAGSVAFKQGTMPESMTQILLQTLISLSLSTSNVQRTCLQSFQESSQWIVSLGALIL